MGAVRSEQAVKASVSALPEQRASQGFPVFALSGEEYAFALQKLQTLRDDASVTSVTNAPGFLNGLLNPRGIIVPIIDMRIRFHPTERPYHVLAVVVILNIAARAIGRTVDDDSDGATRAPKQIKPAPTIHASINDTGYMVAPVTLNNCMFILLCSTDG